MNPNLIAALADQRTRETRQLAARPHASSPRSVSQPGSQSPNRAWLRRRIGTTLVEAGLRLMATAPAVPGK